MRAESIEFLFITSHIVRQNHILSNIYILSYKLYLFDLLIPLKFVSQMRFLVGIQIKKLNYVVVGGIFLKIIVYYTLFPSLEFFVI